jgi:hypothetical protein
VDQFPGFDSLYEMGCHSWHGFRAHLSLIPNDPDAALRGETQELSVTGVWTMGRGVPSDIAFSKHASLYLLSERVVDQLHGKQLTGWRAIKCDLRNKDGTSPPVPYYLLVVTGRCGPILYSKSERFDKQMPGGIFREWRGNFFEPNTWDGTDFFLPESTTLICVTQRAKDAIQGMKIRSLEFRAMSYVERTFSYDEAGRMVFASKVE